MIGVKSSLLVFLVSFGALQVNELHLGLKTVRGALTANLS
jgi:hypothetical protein